MAPPTPVYSKDEVLRVFELDKLVDEKQCELKSLTQFECGFSGGLSECVPFKRVFQDCVLRNGQRQRIEITGSWTNSKEKIVEIEDFFKLGELKPVTRH